MNDGNVHLSIVDSVAAVTFDRPKARNAMTWAMYARLGEICKQLGADASIRVVTFRGAGGEAFVAGTDIAQFAGFEGDAGVSYERRIDTTLGLVEALPMPTVAIVDGWCVGGGLAIATTCDFRVCTQDARFGVPIARTLGNTLSTPNLARLVAAFGLPRVQRMLLLAEILDADEALACGFVYQCCASAALDSTVEKLVKRLGVLAPVTQRTIKESLRRLVQHNLPDSEDLIFACYDSADFREGVDAFVRKRSPDWKGQ